MTPKRMVQKARKVLPDTGIQWIFAVTALSAAVFGPEGIRSVTGYRGETELKVLELTERLKRQEDSLEYLRFYLDRLRREDMQRWAIVVGTLCKLNGGKEFARRVDCEEVDALETNGFVKINAVFPGHSQVPIK